jgi:hypothetical protein
MRRGGRRLKTSSRPGRIRTAVCPPAGPQPRTGTCRHLRRPLNGMSDLCERAGHILRPPEGQGRGTAGRGGRVSGSPGAGERCASGSYGAGERCASGSYGGSVGGGGEMCVRFVRGRERCASGLYQGMEEAEGAVGVGACSTARRRGPGARGLRGAAPRGPRRRAPADAKSLSAV